MRLNLLFVLAAVALQAAVSAAQSPVKSIATIFAEGKIDGKKYTNDYFGLTLTIPYGEFTHGGFVSPQGQRARLIQAEANAAKPEDRFSIALLADALSANPLIHSPEQYLRSVRHQFEREGMVTVQSESPVEISGLQFQGATMKQADPQGDHYQGMYTTFLNGYIVSLQVEAASAERLPQIVRGMASFKPAGKPQTK